MIEVRPEMLGAHLYLRSTLMGRSHAVVHSLKNIRRCHWVTNALNIAYHDEEWGVPVHDDRRWFAFLILEGAQAGLSLDTILRKRER